MSRLAIAILVTLRLHPYLAKLKYTTLMREGPVHRGQLHPTLTLHPFPELKYKTLMTKGPIHPTLVQQVVVHPALEPKYKIPKKPKMEGPIHPTLVQ